MNLEDRLRRTLRRVEPGDGFADRVLARVDVAQMPATPPRMARPPRRWALAASLVLAMAVSALVGREAWQAHTHRLANEQLQARQQAATRQLAFALDLTSRELESVHRHLNRQTEETGS